MLKSQRLTGKGKSPILKISGHVDTYNTQDEKSQWKKDEIVTYVTLKMSSIQIMEMEQGAIHPYNVADIPIGKFSDYMGSSYVMFEDSIAEVMGVDMEKVSIDMLVGRDIVIQQVKDHFYGKDKEGKDMTGDWWRVLSVDGAVAVAPIDKFLSMLDGRKKGDIIGEAVADNVIKQDGVLIQEILTGAIFSDTRVTDLFTMDSNDILHKK